VRAAVLRGAGSPAAEEWPRPEIGDGEVLLRLRGCGLCGSDIAKIAAPPTPHPMVVGHEVVGDVVAAGIGAPFAAGERVVFAGGGGEALPLSLSALYSRELTVTATYSSSPVELREALDLIGGGAVRTADLVSHRVSLARLAEGVALVQRHEALKVYVTP
jgi:threonine dehydrogenase-like Zn-dependent dehydrogenase